MYLVVLHHQLYFFDKFFLNLNFKLAIYIQSYWKNFLNLQTV